MFKLKPINSILNKRANFILPLGRTPISSWAFMGTMATFAIGTALPSTGLAATIQGTAFIDINKNGTFESCEPTRANTTIFIRNGDLADTGQGGFFIATTNDKGYYSSISHDPANFTIWAEIPWGQKQTAPVAGEGIAVYDFKMANRNDKMTIDFGVTAASSKNTAPSITSAKFSSTANPIRINDKISFVSTATDPDACDTLTYDWKFGDGKTAKGANVIHAYTKKGTYTATLTVTDNKGLSAKKTMTVKVLGALPVVKLGNDIALDVGEAVDLSGTFSDIDGRPRYNYRWKFGDGNTAVGRRGSTKRPITATHTFLQSGEFTVTLEVTDRDGNTGSATMLVNVRGNNTDACATGVATIRSRLPWGFWNMPTAWSTGKVPGPNDWVLIQKNHRMILPNNLSSAATRLRVKGICIAEKGILQSAFNTLTTAPSVTNINVTSLHNKGTIHGANGVNASLINGSYKKATSGSRVLIWAYKFINATTGVIGGNLGGRGGDDLPYKYLPHSSRWNTQGGAGGQIEIYPNHFTNLGLLEGGRGGNAYNNSTTAGHGANGYVEGHQCSHGRAWWQCVPGVRYVIGSSYGGHGGFVRVFASNIGMSSNHGKFKGGCGGNAYGVSTRWGLGAGKGGDVYANVGTNAGQIKGCRGSVSWWDPTTLKATATTVIEGSDKVIIFGGEDWTMDLAELREGAVSAADTITIAVGKGGIVDLPDTSSGKVFQAGTKLEIFADTIRMGGQVVNAENVENALKALVDAPNITVSPAKILYRVELSHANHRVGEPNETLSVNLAVLNGGPVEDTYTITMTDTAGWEISTLPETVTINSMRRSELAFDVTLPAQRGQENRITVTVTSQNDAKVQEVAEIIVNVPEKEVITPRTQEDDKAMMTFVVEDTQTMGGDILVAANAMEKILFGGGQVNTQENQADAQPKAVEISQAELDQINAKVEADNTNEKLLSPTIELITFKDDVTPRLVTDNFGEAIGRLRSIQPVGGDDCPNASVAAIESALENMQPNGQIFLITASPPHQETAVVIAKAKEKGIKINVMLTGSCGDEAANKALYQHMAEETGGRFNESVKGTTPMINMEQAISTVIEEGLQEVVAASNPEETNQDDDANNNSGENQDGNENANNDEPGEYTLSGTIFDDLGNPIAGVTLKLGDTTATTDAKGHWEIADLPEGAYTLTPNKTGYTFSPDTIELGNDEFDRQITLKPLSALAVNITVEPRQPKLGENVTYISTVTNGGTQTATDVILTQTLPEGTNLVSLTPLNGGDCNTDTLTCTLPAINTGDQAEIQFVVSNTQEDKRLQITATVDSNEYPTDVQVKRTTITADLSVAMTCSPKTLMPQGELNCAATVQLSEYAENAATAVKLTMTLPQGVQLDEETLDNRCLSETSTTLTCALADLNIASQTVINFTQTLQDPGLLLLTNQAQITANEYPTSIARTRTKIYIPPEYQVDMILVVDVTGSMQKEMAGTKDALTQFVEQRDATDFPLSALIIFRDEVSVTAITKNMTILTNAIGNLKAAGGGMCQEASAEALEIAIRHVKTDGTIVLVTDASPYDDANLEGITDALKEKAIKFHPFVTGDCTDQDSWNALPN